MILESFRNFGRGLNPPPPGTPLIYITEDHQELKKYQAAIKYVACHMFNMSDHVLKENATNSDSKVKVLNL